MRGVVQPPGFDIPLRNKEKEVVAWARCSEMHKNEVMKYTWHLSGKYARANIERKNVFMHAFIIKVLEGIEVKKGEVIDHFNPEGGPNNQLDNRVERLRVVSVKQNGQNQSKRKDVSSKYMGVSYDKASGMWFKLMASDTGSACGRMRRTRPKLEIHTCWIETITCRLSIS
jgi:hypothetical protein